MKPSLKKLMTIGMTAALVPLAALSQTVIPLLKDGQVVSADTFNDIFRALAGSNFSQSELVSTWTCKTEELSARTPTAGMPNSNFSVDATTGFYTGTNTWTITNGGNDLSVDLFALGGMGAALNYTSACGGSVTTFGYSIKLLAGGEYIAFKGADLCTTPNTAALIAPLKKVSTNSFMIPFSDHIVTCVDNTPVPDPAHDLVATVSGSGVALSWSAPAGGLVAPTSYDVLKKSNGNFVSIGTAATTTFTDSAGSPGDIYRVVSSHSNGSGMASAAAKAE